MAYIPSECSLEEYEEVIYSGDAKNRLYVKHGDTIIGTNGDNNASPFASKLTVKRRILKNGSKTITLNNFISQEIDLVLHDYKIEDLSEEIEIKIGTFIDNVNDYVYVPLGKFLIQDNPTTDKDKTTYKLRDFSVKFDFYYNGKPLIDANGGSATKMQILQDICKQAGVVCKINSFTGYNEKIGIYDNSVTARIYIADLAEQAGKMASINRYGELIFVDITSDDKTATGEKSIIINDALEKRINSFIVEGKSEQETILPSEYTQVDYLQSNGNQYIDIGIKPSATISTKAIFSVTDVNAERNYVYGTYSGTGINRYQISYSSSFILIGYGSLSDRNRTTTVDNNKHYLEEKNGQLTIDNVKVSSLSSTFDDGVLNIYLFACNSNGTVSNYSNGVKIYLFEVYNSDTLIRKLVPCYRNSDNVAGMYDLVNDEFYENNGTGVFTYGNVATLPSPDYPSEIKTVKGIENLLKLTSMTGYQYGSSLPTVPTNNITINNFDENNVSFTINNNSYLYVLSNNITLKPNTTYTLSYNRTNNNYSVSRYFIYNVSNEGNYSINKWSTDNGGQFSIDFTTDDTGIIALAFGSNNAASGGSSVITNIQIEEGTIAHPFVPYGSRYLYNKITGKNEFNKDDVLNNIVINTSGGEQSGNNYTTSNYINCLPNTNYAISFNYVSGGDAVMRIACYDKNKNFISRIDNSSTKNYIQKTPSNCYYIRLSFQTSAFNNIQVEEQTATDYEPYKEKIITYDLKKENLLSNNPSDWEQGTTSFVDNGVSTTRIKTKDYIEIDETKKYSMSLDNSNYCFLNIDLYNSNKIGINTYYNAVSSNINGSKNIILTFPSGVKYIKPIIRNVDNVSVMTPDEIINIKPVLYEGTGSEDYYELLEINGTRDKLDEVSGVLTKRIGKVVLDGSESNVWAVNETTYGYQFDIANLLGAIGDNSKKTLLSNKFKASTFNDRNNGDTNIIYGYSNDSRIRIKTDVATTVEEWKTYLSNNPVTVYYILAEPETIQLEPIEISTFEGTNNITLIDNIDTNINVNYEGQKHIHNISPDIVESFTVGDKYKVSKVLFEAGANKFEDGTDDDDILYLNSDNPYINKQTQINNIFPHVKGFEINSFKTGKILGNPAVDPADLIKVEYNGIIYKTLAQYTLNFGGTMTSNYETTVEHEAKQSNVANKGFATKKFVKAELDNIDAKFSVEVGEINDGLSDLETNVTNTANRVSDTESKLNDTNSNLENLIGRTTKLEQDNQSWTFEFNNIYEDLTALNNKTNETDKTTKEIKDYIKFVDGNIILEGTDSKCSVVISKEKISFYTDGNESAFISNNELYITDNTVLNKQTIGKWEIKPDSEGNLNTRWIG